LSKAAARFRQLEPQHILILVPGTDELIVKADFEWRGGPFRSSWRVPQGLFQVKEGWREREMGFHPWIGVEGVPSWKG